MRLGYGHRGPDRLRDAITAVEDAWNDLAHRPRFWW
jgi:hypothetical protein